MFLHIFLKNTYIFTDDKPKGCRMRGDFRRILSRFNVAAVHRAPGGKTIIRRI